MRRGRPAPPTSTAPSAPGPSSSPPPTPPPGGLALYGRLLSTGPALRPFLAALLARLPIAVAPLSMVVLVQQVSGSYGTAGLVTGAFALGTAVGAPVWGRAMDRTGQPRVVVGTSLASALLLVALTFAALRGASDLALIALAALAGVTFPVMSPALRAAWRATLPDPAVRRSAFALDAAAVELLFVLGPLLLSGLLLVGPASTPLLVSAGALVAGGLAYASTDTARQAPRGRPDQHGSSGPAATAPGVPLVLVTGLALAVAFGCLDTSLTATARTVLGDPARLGVLFAAIAGGSTTGGLLWGSALTHAREFRVLPVTLGVLTLGLTPVALLLHGGRAPLALLLPLLFVAGLAIAPSLIIQQNTVDQLSRPGRASETQAWLSTAITSGGAAGTAMAGALVDAAGVSVSFGAAAAAGAVAAGVALLGQPGWRRLLGRDAQRWPVSS